jgi:uncharacterized protein
MRDSNNGGPPSQPAPRCFSDWSARGYDITHDSLHFGRRKVVLQGYGPTGFDVDQVLVKKDADYPSQGSTVHYNGSIFCFPHGVFLWNHVRQPADVTLERVRGPVLLHHPPRLEYLFLGCNNNSSNSLSRRELDRIKLHLAKYDIVVECMSISNAMGTFNILNAEDRPVAAALVLDTTDES